jgi:hypothetical protein
MMPSTKKSISWQIRGYDSSTKIFDELIPVGQITLSNLEELLRSLAARALSDREIVGAYSRQNTKKSNGFLRVRKENDALRRRTNYYCGHNPHYVAVTITIDNPTDKS